MERDESGDWGANLGLRVPRRNPPSQRDGLALLLAHHIRRTAVVGVPGYHRHRSVRVHLALSRRHCRYPVRHERRGLF